MKAKFKLSSPIFVQLLLSLFLILPFSQTAFCQGPRTEIAGIPVNYDESKVPEYSLPDVLQLENGDKVKDAETWVSQRRPELIRLFENEQFGKMPDRSHVHFKVHEAGTSVLQGAAIRKQVTIYFTEDTSNYKADLLIYLPAQTKSAPLFLSINFAPNSLSVEDPGVLEGMMWNREGKRIPTSEGRKFGTMNVQKFITEGIGVACIYYGDIEPDFADGLKYGIIGHYLKEGETSPKSDEWGAISAWAWGLSCAMDYLQSDQQIDSNKIALYGVSRLGKTALWTGAHDERFALVIASCSGEGGAAISRRQYGETIKHMIDSTRYFYQFCANRAKYGDHPNTCPVDAHMLVALVAPRPLLLQTGNTDYWSDPKGEFVSAVAAGPVYNLFGKKGLETNEWPAAGTPILNDLGYFMHDGGHGPIPSDYDIYIEFLKKHFLNQ